MTILHAPAPDSLCICGRRLGHPIVDTALDLLISIGPARNDFKRWFARIWFRLVIPDAATTDYTDGVIHMFESEDHLHAWLRNTLDFEPDDFTWVNDHESEQVGISIPIGGAHVS